MSDEYDAYNDFADITEESFASVPALSGGLPQDCAAPPINAYDDFADITEDSFASVLSGVLAQDRAAPSINIEVEGSQRALPEKPSPIREYRPFGTLSVTDLISLAWCEVQFDYGLRQGRNRRLADRKPSFQLDSGKELVVQQEVAARNDKITKRGRFIHKELELELRPEEIKIVITSEEERWGLRLLNFLSSMVSLAAEGCAREIPVVGIINNVVVVGIVDELLIRNPAPPETGTKRASDSPLPFPKRPYRTPSPPCEADLYMDAPALTPSPQHSIRVIDTKTRRTNSLPSEEDTEPARLQVMLYHRLLSALLADFDYFALWTRLKLNPSAPFSGEFVQQEVAILGDESLPMCLDDTVALLRTRMAELAVPALNRTVEIIYRSQNKYPTRRQRKGKGRETSPHQEEEDELAKAIAMSLTDTFEMDMARALSGSLGLDVPPQPDGVPSESVQGPSDVLAGCSTPILNDGWRQSTADPQPPDSAIIGTKEFPMDDALLDAYLAGALQWWHGARKAHGVSERQTGRCNSCEYINGCEWREQKAAEALLRYRLSKGGP